MCFAGRLGRRMRHKRVPLWWPVSSAISLNFFTVDPPEARNGATYDSHNASRESGIPKNDVDPRNHGMFVVLGTTQHPIAHWIALVMSFNSPAKFNYHSCNHSGTLSASCGSLTASAYLFNRHLSCTSYRLPGTTK